MEAEEKNADVSPTPEVDETPTTQEVAELEETNDQEFDDSGQEQVEVEENSPSNTDTELATETNFADKFKKKQSKEENAEWARKRRAEQQAKTQAEEAEKKAYIKGLIDSVDGINPYTNEKIETEEDVEEFKLMREIDKNGDDPLADYHKYLKKQKQEKQEIKAKEFDYVADRKLFEEKHPDIDVKSLVEDKDFANFAEGLIGIAPLSSIFDKYVEINNTIQKKVKEQVKVEMSKKISSTGSLRQTQNTNTKISFNDLSDDEFEKIVQKARNGELRRR